MKFEIKESWSGKSLLSFECDSMQERVEQAVLTGADFGGANRGQCLARLKQYQAEQPLRLDWKNQSGNPSAAADSPISQ